MNKITFYVLASTYTAFASQVHAQQPFELRAIQGSPYHVTIVPDIEKAYEVAQGEIAIALSHQELRTAGMTTCSAIVIRQKGKTLLGHIDAKTPVSLIVNAVKNNFDLNDPAIEAYLIPGDGLLGPTKLSEDIIQTAFEQLNLNNHISIGPSYTNFFDTLIVPEQGTLYVANIPVEKEEIKGPDGLTYVFETNVRADYLHEIGNGNLLYSPMSFATGKTDAVLYEHSITGKAKGGFDGLVGIYTLQR